MTLLEDITEPWQALDPARWSSSNATVADGRVHIGVDEGPWGAAYSSHVELVTPGQLEGSSFTIELVAPAEDGDTQTTQTRLELHTGTPHGESLLFELDGDELHAGYRLAVGGLAQWVAVRDYSMTAHRWLRFRAAAEVVSWEVSPDGYDWTELGAWPATFSLDALRVRLEAGFWGPVEGEWARLPLDPAVFGPANPSLALPDDPTTMITANGEAPSIAVDLLPDNAPGTFLADESTVDGDDLLAWGSGGDSWVNIVCDVTRVRAVRGATRHQGVLTRTEAGSCELALIDTERRFDPIVNADAVHPGIPLRVRAWGPGWSEVLFTGRIGDDLDVQYRRDGAPTVTLTAVDVVGEFARYAASGRDDPGVGAGDDLLERIERVALEAGRDPSVIAYDSDRVYLATLAPTTLQRAWEEISEATDAELGRVWVTRHNRVAVRSRGSELSGPVRGTLSDWHGESVEGTLHCCYDDATVRYGTELLTNRAVAGRRVPATEGAEQPPPSALVQVDDPVSQARYSGGVPVTVDRRTLELEHDAQLEPWARWVVGHGAEPELRVDRVSVAPRGAPESWPQVAATDIGDRWAFRLHPTLGATVSRTLGVLGLEHTITPESWQVVFTTVDAPTPTEGNPSGWLLVGDSDVGSGDLLWAQGAVAEWLPTGA